MLKVLPGGTPPTKATKHSAGVDLYANAGVTIGAGETKLVPLGVMIDLEKLQETFDQPVSGTVMNFRGKTEQDFVDFLNSHYIQLMLRSSLGKKGLILPNGVGIIDLDFPKEIMMIVHNPLRMVDYDAENNTMHQYGAVDDESKRRVNAKYACDYVIKKGDKIGQVILLEHKTYLFGIESDVERTDGLGSTGN